MVVANRNLKPGTILVGRYRKQEFTCEVVGIEGKLFYRVKGNDFTSPSAAGTAVTNHACNGWAFWSETSPVAIAPAPVPPPAPAPAATVNKAVAKPDNAVTIEKPAMRLIRKVGNQHGVPDNQVRWFCPACAKSFMVQKDQIPEACPSGHPATSKQKR